MKIRLVRTGGVAGIRREIRIETADLRPEEAERIHRCIDDCRFFELPPRPSPGKPEPDRFHYELTVEHGDRSHSVSFAEGREPAELRPLIEVLTAGKA